MNEEVDKIIKVMNQVYGKEISMYDKPFLVRSLEKRWVAVGANTVADYCRYLENNSMEADVFFSSLNINYSEFFRNPLTFALLEQWILPKLISEKSGGGEIRVWSAGCSAGQEPYSIAMLLDKLDGISGKPIRFRIFATDTSHSALEIARAGVYDKDAVQNVKVKQLNDYFTKIGENYQISSRLRDRITFSTYDLLDKSSANPPGSIYGDFDIVFCSNLLFYYKMDIRNFILHKVQQSMNEHGYLVTGKTERRLVEESDRLQMVAPPAAVFQIKNKRGMI